MPRDDVFISYASEDRERFVVPLVRSLSERHLKVGWDQERLLAGDSLVHGVLQAMGRARLAALVLSTAYVKKHWPQREMGQLIASHRGRLIPILLPDLKREELARHWPELATVGSVDAGLLSVDAVADQIALSVRHHVTEVLESVTARTRAVLVRYQVDDLIGEDEARAALPTHALRDHVEVGPPLEPFGDLLRERPRDPRAWVRAFEANDLFAERLRDKDQIAGTKLKVHLFGLAPLVLMLHLGYRLRSQSPRPLLVYQPPDQRPPPWTPLFDIDAAAPVEDPFFTVEGLPPTPRDGGGHVALVIGVTHRSCDAAVQAFRARYQDDLVGVVRMQPARDPSPQAVRDPGDIASAAQQFRKVLDDIRDCFGRAESVLLALSGPASLAVALGLSFRHNAHKPMMLHHYFSDTNDYVPVHLLGEGHG